MRAVLLAACLLAAACAVPLDPPPSGDPSGGEPPHAGGTLRLGAADDVHTLDPAVGYDTGSWAFEAMLFNTLVDYDEGTTIVPELAEAYGASPDGRHYWFALRHQVRFSSGRLMSSADVKYSIERVLKSTPTLHSPGAEFYAGIDGAADYAAGKASEVRGITTPAPDRVEFTLVEVDPLFLHKLAMPFSSVVDREAVERVGDLGFRRQPVGTGGFVLTEWVEGQRMRLARNPLYFRQGLPYLDGIDVTVGLSDQLTWFKYQRGELDLGGVPSAEFARVVADARYKPLLLERTTLRTNYLGLNCEMPPFDQLVVRQAFNMAIDKQRLLDLIDGRGVVANAILPPDMPGYDPETPGYPHDPAAARKRLADAGVGGELRATLWASRDEISMRLAQSIQQDVRQIGIDLALKPVDFTALIEGVRHPGIVPLFLLAWEADFPDASNFLTVLLHSKSRGTNNNAFYSNPAVDRLLDEAEPLLDTKRRVKLFQEAEKLVMRDAPWVPLFHPVGFAIRHPRVRDYRLHPLRPSRVETVWLAW